MNDLERDVRAVLERDAERAPLVTQAPPDVRTRVRRRQAGTVLTSTLVVAALVAGSVVGLQAVRDQGRGSMPALPDDRQNSQAPDEDLPEGAIASGDDWTLYLRDWTEYPRDAGDGICFDLMGPENDETTCNYVWPPSGYLGTADIAGLPDDRALLFGFLQPEAAAVRVDNRERAWTVERSTFPPPEGFRFEGVVFFMELPAGRAGSTITVLDHSGQELSRTQLPAVGTGFTL